MRVSVAKTGEDKKKKKKSNTGIKAMDTNHRRELNNGKVLDVRSSKDAHTK